jgi:hypothetical protein
MSDRLPPGFFIAAMFWTAVALALWLIGRFA